MNPARRVFLKALSVLPFGTGQIFPAGLRQSSAQNDDDIASDRTALEVVRLFGTIELHYFLKNGQYASKDELLSFVPASWFVAKGKDPSKSDFFRQLRVGEDEVVRGWRLSISKTSNGAGFFMTLARLRSAANSQHNSVYVCDESGIIMVGGPNLDWNPNDSYVSVSSVPGLGYIDHDPILNAGAGKFGLLRKLAFAALSAASPSVCGCNCVCRIGTGTCYCWNSGCQSCPWCCANTGSCSDCYVCTLGHICACCQ